MLLDRDLIAPKKSFFLFGPRGVGKSTWLKRNVNARFSIDLLKSEAFFDYSAAPQLLRERTNRLKKGDWVVLDEIQRVPQLLNEVHLLYEERGLNFALSGSSARKLKRGGANLLAGRALQSHLFPFTFRELGSRFSLRDWMEWGALPLVVQEPRFRKDTLAAYIETYLRQELLEEGLIRKLDPFSRFLKVAGIVHGQVMNVESISRDSKVRRTTVDQYFGVLEDTLLGFRLPAFQPAAKVKEVSHMKFYLFDSGVSRACAGLLHESVDSVWSGIALETGLLNEVRAYNHYHGKNRDLFYYRISGGYEIDLVIEIKKKTLSQPSEIVLAEFKHSKKWDSRWEESMRSLMDSKAVKVKSAYGVYLGNDHFHHQGVEILPVEMFLKQLHEGRIF